MKCGVPDTEMARELPNLLPILTRAIDWSLIEQQYDELIKYAAALQHRTADAESILRRFARASVQRPSYKALAQLGKAIKTIFLTAISARKPSGAKSTKCRLAVNGENAVVRSGLAVYCENGVARILHFICNRISVKVMNPFNSINRNSACSGAELPGEATGIFVLEENTGPVRRAVSKHDGPTFDEFDLAKLPLFRNVVDLQRQPSDPASKRRHGVAPALVRPKCPMQRSGREGMSLPRR
ncbi:hypothetical protein MESS2_1000067 [Mesorhizobium metallidurans STM 2683]|uniref:Tn3 transposase DDE domain-containing protein n=1 Tax=Mesorhizobium metallidurans STM 2683 TaxID=1297569 RepID=M5EFT9_9HYPH|nr:hypothetical protein MESS2_1000067 [Mesorhizobium metallidurans STM 2683]